MLNAEKYDNYKPSGIEFIGDIPKHWEIKKLKYIVDKIMGGGTPLTSNSDYWTESRDDGLLWVAIADITKSEYLEDTKKYITEEGLKNSSAQRIEPYSILYSIYASLGKVAYSPYELTTNQAILAIKPSEELLYKFLFYYLKTLEDKLPFLSSSTTQNNISLDVVKNFNITQPPYDEQEKIVKFIDMKNKEIEEFISDKKKQISLLEEQKEAIINKAVTKGLDDIVEFKDSGIEWIGDIPKHWEVRKLKYVASFKSGEMITSEMISEEGSFKVYGGGGFRGYTSSYTNDGEYVLIGRQGALCGNIKYAKGKFWASEHSIVVYPKIEIENIFLGEVLKIANLGNLSQTAAQPGISISQIKNVSIAIPSSQEQKKIVKYIEVELSKINEIKKQIQQEIDLIQEYKISLISEVVTGQIKVV